MAGENMGDKSRPKDPEQKQEQMKKDGADIADRENPSITRAAIAKKLEITDSQARTAIDMLKDSGKIHREGSDKGGRWIIG